MQNDFENRPSEAPNVLFRRAVPLKFTRKNAASKDTFSLERIVFSTAVTFFFFISCQLKYPLRIGLPKHQTYSFGAYLVIINISNFSYFRINQHENENKMSLHNLATVFGPTLLRPSSKVTNLKEKDSLASGTVDVMAQAGILYCYLQELNSRKDC